MELARMRSDWIDVIKYMMRIVSILDQAQRGRIISLVKSHALLGNPVHEYEEKVCVKMRKVLEVDSKTLMPKIISRWPVVLPLFSQGLCYHKNAELCKVTNMCINCIPLIGDDLKLNFQAFGEHVEPRIPVKEWLIEWGISNDLHILGTSEKSLSVFLEIGMCTQDTCNFGFGNPRLSIKLLEENYAKQKMTNSLLEIEKRKADKKRARYEERFDDNDDDNVMVQDDVISIKHTNSKIDQVTVKMAKVSLEVIENRDGKKKQKFDELMDSNDLNEILEAIGIPNTNTKREIDGVEEKMVKDRAKAMKLLLRQKYSEHIDYVGDTDSNAKKDSEYIELIGPLLGFKNATSKAITKTKIGPFYPETIVFVKVGETRENNDASRLMYEAMHILEMPSVQVCVLPVIWDEDRWERHSLVNVTLKTQSWGPAMMRKMKSTVKNHEKEKRHLTMQVCNIFKGVRLGWMEQGYPLMQQNIWRCPIKRTTFGKTLYEAIFFAVFVGATDSGPFNTMVDEDGHVLLVDIGIADEMTMLTYNTKGLFRSSRKYPERYISAVVSYVNQNYAEAADFIVRLKKVATKNPYLLRNEMCPFFDKKNIKILQSGQKNTPYFKFLISSLQFNPKQHILHPQPFMD